MYQLSARISQKIPSPNRQKEKPIWILTDDKKCELKYLEILGLNYRFRVFESFKDFQSTYVQKQRNEFEMIIVDQDNLDLEFLKFLEERTLGELERTKIFLISKCDNVETIRTYLKAGVSEYITKPFNRSEFLVRIERLLDSSGFIQDEFTIDPLRRCVSGRDNVEVELTSKELLIFNWIYQASNVGIKRSDLIKKVWHDVSIGGKTIDVHIFNLRRKIAKLNLKIRYTNPQTYNVIRSNSNVRLENLTYLAAR